MAPLKPERPRKHNRVGLLLLAGLVSAVIATVSCAAVNASVLGHGFGSSLVVHATGFIPAQLLFAFIYMAAGRAVVGRQAPVARRYLAGSAVVLGLVYGIGAVYAVVFPQNVPDVVLAMLALGVGTVGAVGVLARLSGEAVPAMSTLWASLVLMLKLLVASALGGVAFYAALVLLGSGLSDRTTLQAALGPLFGIVVLVMVGTLPFGWVVGQTLLFKWDPNPAVPALVGTLLTALPLAIIGTSTNAGASSLVVCVGFTCAVLIACLPLWLICRHPREPESPAQAF